MRLDIIQKDPKSQETGGIESNVSVAGMVRLMLETGSNFKSLDPFQFFDILLYLRLRPDVSLTAWIFTAS